MIFPDNFILIMSKTNGKEVMYHLRLSAGIYKRMKGKIERSKKIVSFFPQYTQIKMLLW